MAVTVQRSSVSLSARRRRANLFCPIADVLSWLAPGKQKSGHVRRYARAKVRCVHPSHPDQVPSATAFLEQNRFFCWVCRRGGRPVSLTEWVLNCDQGEAIGLLEERFHLSAFPLEAGTYTTEPQSLWDTLASDVEALILVEFVRARRRTSRFVWSVWSGWFWDIWDLRGDFGLTLMGCKRLARSVIRRYLSG